MKKETILAMLIVAGIVYSCEQRQPVTEEQSVPSSEMAGDRITLSLEQVQRAGLSFGAFEEVELSHDVNAPGRLYLPNDNMARVSSMVNGIVHSIDIHIGNPVAKGTRLCRLVHPDIIQIQEIYIKAKLEYKLAGQDYERQQVLKKEKVSAGKVFQVSERDYFTAKATYESLRLRLKLAGFNLEAVDRGEIRDYLDVLSPIKGIVDKINVNLGNLAGPEVELFHIVCKEHMYLEVMVFEKDIPLVKVGQRVTFQLSNFSEHVYESEIFSIGSSLDMDTRSIPVFAEFEDVPDNIYPGMFVAATIHTGEGIFTSLPESAIISERQDEHYLFYTMDDIKGAQLNFRKVAVTIGLSEDEYVQVDLAEPLPEGAMIVIDGGYYVRAEMLRSLE